MLKRVLPAAAVLALLAGPALAAQCPANIRQIDAALQSNTQLSAADKAKATELRNEGEKLHAAGQHQQSMDKLAEAKKILKIQ
jgi:azurin